MGVNLIKIMPNAFTNIIAAAPTTTTISARSCILAGLTINKATANGVITIYNGDAASGTLVATITSPATLLHNQVPLDFHDICLPKGCTIVTSSGAQDITVAHRAA